MSARAVLAACALAACTGDGGLQARLHGRWLVDVDGILALPAVIAMPEAERAPMAAVLRAQYGPIAYTFEADGRVAVSKAAASSEGRYEILSTEGDTLRLRATRPGPPASTFEATLTFADERHLTMALADETLLLVRP